ncbi:MAG: hypothetical protein J5594_05675 [Elusimicrobiaceae bacterium]|nr:hypothetical protein [Elusimicrobiaceae bacterium]MBR4151749.1 hypothetical protein [Selenomonadaceae bacterium]
MALAWTITDSQPKSIYNALYKWYGVPDNFPNYQTGAGVFFNYANFTLDKLYYCIQALKNYYSLGWFTDNYTDRTNALKQIAATLYDTFSGQVDANGIFKFLVWVYNFAKQNEAATKYFCGDGTFNVIDSAAVVLDDVVVKPVEKVAETIKYAVDYPSLKNLFPDNTTLFKWGLIIGGGLYLWKFFENRIKKI